MKRVLVVIALLAACEQSAAASSTPPPVRITVTAFSCAQDVHQKPEVNVLPEVNGVRGRPTALHDLRWDNVAAGAWNASFYLKPGYYLVTATSAHCHTAADYGLLVIPAHARYLVLPLSTFVAVDAHSTDNAVAVILPVQGLAVEMRTQDGCRFVQRAVIDDGVAYFDSLPPGAFYVRVYTGAFSAVKALSIPETATYQHLESISLAEAAAQFRSTTALNANACSTR